MTGCGVVPVMLGCPRPDVGCASVTVGSSCRRAHPLVVGTVRSLGAWDRSRRRGIPIRLGVGSPIRLGDGPRRGGQLVVDRGEHSGADLVNRAGGVDAAQDAAAGVVVDKRQGLVEVDLDAVADGVQRVVGAARLLSPSR